MLVETAGNMNTGRQAATSSGICNEFLYTRLLRKTGFQMGSIDMAGADLPPQRLALYSAGGGFGGALLAIIVAKILSGPCCCCCAQTPHEDERREAATVSAVTDARSADRSAAAD